MDADLCLALRLQKEFDEEHVNSRKKKSFLDVGGDGPSPKKSLIDPSLEYTDPTPDVHKMFENFDKRFFWSSLGSVEVSWSPRMTSCAGICQYYSRSRATTIRLSLPLLKLRPRKDLVETLLHEMIHAYLFVTNNNRDRDGHGPEFQSHMSRINQSAGTNITIYHTFHAEVNLYKTHWWRCNGPCQYHKPFYGMVKRTMNRAPGPSDFWFADHQRNCGGVFVKVKEPENFKSKKKLSEKEMPGNSLNKVKTLQDFLKKPGSKTESKSSGVNGFGNSGVKKPNSTTVSKGGSATELKTSNSGAFSAKKGGTFTATKGGAYTVTVKPKVSSSTSGTSTSPKPEMSMSSTASSTTNGVKTFSELNSTGNTEGDQAKRPVPQNIVPFSGKGHTLGKTTVPVSDKPWLKRFNAISNGGTGSVKSSSIDRYLSNSSASSGTVGTKSSSIGSYKSNSSILSGTKSSTIQRYKSSTSMPSGSAGAKTPGIERYMSSTSASSDSAGAKTPGIERYMTSTSASSGFTGTGNHGLGTSPSSSSHVAVSPLKTVRVGFPKDEAQCSVACPLCNESVKACDINQHLDLCLNYTVLLAERDLPEDEQCEKGTWDRIFKDDENDDDDFICCPMCEKKMQSRDLDRHLELCIKDEFDNDMQIRDEQDDDIIVLD